MAARRVQAIAQQVAAQPAAAAVVAAGVDSSAATATAAAAAAAAAVIATAAAADTAPATGNSGPLQVLSEVDQAAVLQTVLEYRKGADQLCSDGTLPSMSLFDVQIATKHEMGVPPASEIEAMLDEAEAKGSLKVLDLLPGPWHDARTKQDKVRLLRQVQVEFLKGMDVFLYARWQQQYGDSGLSSNIAFPKIQPYGIGSQSRFVVIPRVLLANPADAERISRVHVRKEGNFEQALYDSVIATTDNEHWRRQRRHLSEAFMPSALADILPVSLSRAKRCAERLAAAAAGGAAVDMSDFLLHEAQAQLQLALLGAPEEVMDATNADIRASFMGDMPPEKIGALGCAMETLMRLAREDRTLALPSDGCPARGPLSRAVQTSELTPSADYGNMLLILFAGHDTTGHTMTWLLFELARRPEVQRKLQAEVDAFFAALGDRDPHYMDLGHGLDFLDRCLTETLRLWPAVPNGTFRQLQFPEKVVGAAATKVELPLGTPVQIVNWSRHRNPQLWGPDADEFNPLRQFENGEVARVGCPLAGVTPQSERFSPFAHAPRSCLGRNFAQMEMRLIMLYLLRRFDFALAPPYDRLVGVPTGPTPDSEEFRGVNRGTMGPMDLERASDHSWGRRHVYAMKMHVKSRA